MMMMEFRLYDDTLHSSTKLKHIKAPVTVLMYYTQLNGMRFSHNRKLKPWPGGPSLMFPVFLNSL